MRNDLTLLIYYFWNILCPVPDSSPVIFHAVASRHALAAVGAVHFGAGSEFRLAIDASEAIAASATEERKAFSKGAFVLRKSTSSIKVLSAHNISLISAEEVTRQANAIARARVLKKTVLIAGNVRLLAVDAFIACLARAVVLVVEACAQVLGHFDALTIAAWIARARVFGLAHVTSIANWAAEKVFYYVYGNCRLCY